MAFPAAASALLMASLPAQAGLSAELRESWASYRAGYISPDGRVIDFRNGSITSSEGQAYALVRAGWVGDRATFDLVLRWTRDNLQGGDPAALPAWKWGQADDGAWRVLDPEPASDADQLLAWALLGAARRWGNPAYEAQAKALLPHIWDDEVARVADAWVLLPGRWARGGDPVRVNPSYVMPFVWRDFARVDAAHPWLELLDDSYRLLARCRAPTGLASDWCYLDATTGRPVPAPEPAHADFGFEAFRVAWTLAAEIKWHREPRARALLGPYVNLLSRPPAPVRIPGTIRADGSAAVEWEYPGMIGALVPAWGLRRPAAAQRMWDQAIVPLRTDAGWGDPNDYYGQNWIWFGLVLWQSKERPA